MTNKHIIFSDVDGTIYPSKKTIHKDTLKHIKLAQDLGVEFVICTGNGYFDNMAKLAEKLNARYVITSNGATIFDREENDFIFTSKIPKAKAVKLLEIGQSIECKINWWDLKKVYFNKFTDEKNKKIIENAMTENKNWEMKDSIDDDILKIEFYDTPDKIDKILGSVHDSELELARMKAGHLEITHSGVSKGEAIAWLVKEKGLSLKNTMGIGDSANDLPMFKVVGHSYAMANASDEAKEQADHHTAAVEQNGLGLAIIDYLHRNKLDR